MRLKSVVMVKSEDGYQFALLESVMIETHATMPFFLFRNHLFSALHERTTPNTTSYGMMYSKRVKEDVFKTDMGHASVYVDPNWIRIGCQTFKGKDAAKIRRWARHYTTE